MKYANILGEGEVTSIEIFKPHEDTGYKYYYPDGLERGILWWKKTYFISRYLPFTGKIYYRSAQEALKDSQGRGVFIRDGRIWREGEVIVTLKSDPSNPSHLKYKDSLELSRFLDDLSRRWEVDLGRMVCLESLEMPILYDQRLDLR